MGYKLLELQQRVKALSEDHDMARYCFDLIEDNTDKVMFPQKEQLFRDSIGSDGKALGFYARDYYEGHFNSDMQHALHTKHEGDPFSMRWSGEFFKGMSIEVEDLRAILSSSSPYLDKMLQNREFLTTEFFGLTHENMLKLIDKYLYPNLMDSIREKVLKIPKK